MLVTVQAILNAAYPAYAATHRLPLRVHKAVAALRRCRTGALGRHAVKCAAGHLVDVRRNSCRHRACPQCGWRKAAQWLEQWQTRLLPVTHFHVIFTLPRLLHTLWRWNRRRCAAAFFRAARDTLFQLLAQERHLGARPGVLMGLHTWGSALPLHPHLHCLVSAGGIQADGRWRASRPDFLLWAPILREVFRAKVVQALEELLTAGKLALPPALDEVAAWALLHEAAQLTWHVRIEPPYAHGRGLVVYLARYLRGGPLKNHRLVAFTGTAVAFHYRHRRGCQRPKWRTMTLPVEEFLDRLLQHVPISRGCRWSAPTACMAATSGPPWSAVGSNSGPAGSNHRSQRPPLPSAVRAAVPPWSWWSPAHRLSRQAFLKSPRDRDRPSSACPTSVGADDALWHSATGRGFHTRRGSNAKTLGSTCTGHL